jgi:hypothetical protein
MENLTFPYFENVSLMVLAGFALFLLFMLKSRAIPDLITFVSVALITFGGPCFIAYYFFDVELITTSSTNPDKIELTVMSYVFLALTFIAGIGTDSKEQRKRFQAYLEAQSEEVQASFKQKNVCTGMPMDLVDKLKGKKFEEKRSGAQNAEKLTYKYGKTGKKNRKGNDVYKLEVTYVDGLVDGYKDL